MRTLARARSESTRFGMECRDVPARRNRVATLGPGIEVSRPGDAYEQEAERAADKVVYGAPTRHRCACGGACPKCRPGRTGPWRGSRLALGLGANAGGRADTLRTVQETLTSNGQPLDDATRSFMEPRLQHDFSGVRVHTDDRASRSAEAVGARAYTVASDIAFRRGEYAPGTTAGVRLLAHELAHVVQQSIGVPQGTQVSRPMLMRNVLDLPEEASGTIVSPARVNAPSPPGWQNVDPQYLLIKAGEPVELPHFLKLNYQDDKCGTGKTRWRIREGRYEDHDVCIPSSALVSASSAPVGPAASARFDIGQGKFWYGGKGPIEATTKVTNPVPTGINEIEIPDFHHERGAGYGDYATTWFRLGHSGDRYLHPGQGSAGCVTIKELSEWPSIWKYLISSRKDHRNVGDLEVV